MTSQSPENDPAADGAASDAQPGDGDTGANPPAEEDDELALQITEEAAPRAPHHPRAIRTAADHIEAKPMQIGDPTSLLVWAAGAVVISIIISAYFLFRPAGTLPPPERERAKKSEKKSVSGSRKSSGKSESSKKSSASKTKPKPISPEKKKKLDKEEALKANTANQTSFHCYYAFMEWAYDKGMELNGEQLATRFKGKVSLSGVDDPDVRNLHGRVLELCADFKERPLNVAFVSSTDITGPHGHMKKSAVERRKKHKLAVMRIRGIAKKLLKRYGKPE